MKVKVHKVKDLSIQRYIKEENGDESRIDLVCIIIDFPYDFQPLNTFLMINYFYFHNFFSSFVSSYIHNK